jgi:hypothetical protein
LKKALLAVLVIVSLSVSTVSAISSADKDRWVMAAEKVMSQQPYILYGDAAFGPDDSMDFWVVPMPGNTNEENMGNIVKSIQTALMSYAVSCHNVPEIADMHLTIGTSPTNAVATAY